MSDQPDRQIALRRQVLLWGVMLAFASLVLVGVLELALRLYYGPGFSAAVIPAYHLDQESGLRLNVNESRPFKRDIWNGGETITWTTDSAGYRGPELMTDSEYRIVLFGDSNIQAEFSELDNTYAMVLQTTLRQETGRNVEVINAGTVGAGPDQNLSRMSQELPVLRPSLVILHVFADNDFGDMVRNALYSVDSGGQLIRSSRRFTKDPAFDMGGRRHALAILQFISDLRRFIGAQRQRNKGPATPSEFIAQWLKTCADEFEKYQSQIAGRSTVLASVLADHYDYDLALFPELEASRVKVRLMEGVLRRAQQIANENGVTLVVLIQPSVRDVSDNQLVTPRMLGAYSADYKPNRLTSIVQDIAERNQIESINLFPSFAGRASQLYFRGMDDHWNDEGQRYAARLTADVLQKRIRSAVH